MLGDLEPNLAVTGHEAGVLVDVVADTAELAKEAAYYAFIRLFIGPYPGRKTTAGNAAAPLMPVVVPVSDVYSFSIYHLLPVADPVAAFPVEVTSFPRTRRVTPWRSRMRLYDCADIIRSKNAGPFAVTIDLFFGDEERYRLARDSAPADAGGRRRGVRRRRGPGEGRLVGRPDPRREGVADALVVEHRPLLRRPVRRPPAHAARRGRARPAEEPS